MQRVRTAVNACNAELRPLRHQLRYTTLRSAILKWTLTGMMLYLLLYTAFYIVVRNNYLFGLSENTSKLLMDQYAKDLMTCWHTSRNVTVPSATVELQYMTVDSIIHNGLTSSLHTGIQSNPRSVVVLHSHPSKRTEVQNVWYRTLLNTNLDAGSCIATAGNQDTTPIVTDIVNRDQASIRHLRNTQSKTSLPQSTTDTRLLALSPSNSSNVDYSMRCLPSFIIAGAMKCGTGELMKWLELHPNLAVGSGANNKREVHYFTSELNKHHTAQRQSNNGNNSAVSSKDTNISKDTTLVEYASFFPEFSAAEASQQYTFEKSPDYIRDRAALHSIRQLMPGMRIVVLLRNPALRALSEFSHHCRHGRFVKFGKEVHIQGKMFHKNTIVRNDVSYTADGNGIGSGANITAGKNSASHTLADLLEGVPKSSYKTLVYPCSAADAERYFTQHSAADGVVAQKGNASSNTDSSIGGGGSSSSSGSNRQSMSGKMREHTVVPELEHGFYDQQLANLLEM